MATALKTLVLSIALATLSNAAAVMPRQSENTSFDLTVVGTVGSHHPDSNNATAASGINPWPGTFQAWSGNSCDGGVGGQIAFDGVSDCIWTDDRHSFVVYTNGADPYPLFINLCYELNCPDTQTEQHQIQSNTCYNVNTGRAWRSTKVLASGPG
jgi:hypothetical protein